MTTIDQTLKERGSRYGEFTDHALITQSLKDAMKASKNWDFLQDDQLEALEMVAHKIGRILNGDPDYIDSWTDIIGYVRLVEKRLVAEQESVRGFMVGDQGKTFDAGAAADAALSQTDYMTAMANQRSIKASIEKAKMDSARPIHDAVTEALATLLAAGVVTYTE